MTHPFIMIKAFFLKNHNLLITPKKLHLYKNVSLSFIFPTLLMDKKLKYYLDNNLKLAIK